MMITIKYLYLDSFIKFELMHLKLPNTFVAEATKARHKMIAAIFRFDELSLMKIIRSYYVNIHNNECHFVYQHKVYIPNYDVSGFENNW